MTDSNGNGISHELLPLEQRPELNDVAAAVDAGLAAAVPSELDEGRGIFAFVVPQGGQLAVVDLEQRLADRQATPRRKRGTVTALTASAFAGYVNRHKGTGPHTPELWALLEQQRLVAVINPHTDSEPGWGDHRAVLQCKRTPAWAAWLAVDGKLGDQEAFAQFIEDHTLDIVRPDGATMLEVAQTLHATIGVDFKSAKRLIDGQGAHVYVESLTATAGIGGRLDIPAEFTLHLAPFEGSAVVEVLARLRFRIEAARLRIGYRLDRPEDVERAAFDTIIADVEQQTSLTAWPGTPIG